MFTFAKVFLFMINKLMRMKLYTFLVETRVRINLFHLVNGLGSHRFIRSVKGSTHVID